MPWFHGKSDEEKQREAEEKQRQTQEAQLQQASLQSLQAGGIPIQAQRRLDELHERSGFFTSDLSVNEFLLARQVGFRPVSQVMGSSIYHIGWQPTPGYYRSFGGGGSELTVISQAMNHARALALGRLAEEAQRVGGDAVIGVHVTRANYEWGGDLIEFNAVGTAVRLDNAPAAKRPALTNLSGQDFWKLYQAGQWPAGVVAASTVYYVIGGWQTQMATSMWGSWANQELQDFTRGLYTARHLAMGRIHQQAQELGGEGVVGMQLEQSEEEREVDLGNDQERTDMIFTFHVIGTAIRQMGEEAKVPPVYAVLNLKP
jgi:uncharacterized protein YbjQ (UPF0145 family)